MTRSQTDWGTYRGDDGDTSWLAAMISFGAMSELKRRLLGLLAQPMTVDERAAAFAARGYPRRTPQRIRTARKQLVSEGFVVELPERGRSALGGRSRCWQTVA